MMEEACGDEKEPMICCVTRGGEPVRNMSGREAHWCLLMPWLLTEAAMNSELRGQCPLSADRGGL